MSVDITTIGIEMQTAGLVKGTAALKDAERQADKTADAVDKTGASAKRASDSFSSFSGVMGAGFAAAGIASLLALANAALSATKALYEASAAAERLKTILDFASGGKGAKEIQYLRDVTDRLGLSFEGTAKAYGQFAAAAKGTALEGQKARDIFEAVSKASAVMGLSTEQSSGALLALQQMISKGTVQAEELRGQLGERLPGAFQIAAKAMGVTTGELGKMLEAGQVVAEDFLPKFAKALEENLGGAAEKAAERLDASVNKYTNSWEKLKQTIGDSGVSKAASNELRALSNEFNVVTETMENVRKSGGGMFQELGAGAGVALARSGFGAINLVANTLNGTINALTGNALGLRTNLALLPDAFKNNAQQAAALASDLKKAEAEFIALKAQSATMGSSIYYKSEIASLAQYIEKLKEAQNAKKDLTGNDPRDIPLSQGRGASYQKFEQEQSAVRKTLNEERLKSAGINKDYIASINAYQQALAFGIITEKEAVSSIATLVKKQQEKTDKARGIKTGMDSEAKAYESLIISIKDKVAATTVEVETGKKISEAEKIRIDVTQKLGAGLLKLTATQKQKVFTEIDALAVKLKLKEAEEEAMKVAVALQQSKQKEADGIESYMRAQEDSRIATVKAANDSVTAAQAEYDNYGKTKSQIAEVTLARLNDKLAGVNAGTAIAESLEAQIKAQKQLIGILASGEAREINDKAAKDAADKWKKTAESIQTSITDALLRGFESGKGFGKNLRDTIVNMFKTLVLRPTISAIVNPVAGAITSSLGLAGTANAATGGGGGILSTLSNLSSLSTLTTAISTGVAGAVGSSVGAIFGTVAGNTALGTTLGLGAGSSLAAASAASVAGGGAAAGAGLSSVAGALGAIGPVGWAALAAAAAFAVFSGNKESASKSTGDLQRSYDVSGAVTSEISRTGAGNAANAIDSLYARLSGLQQLLGAKGAVEFGFSGYSGNGDKNPKGNISGGGFNSGEVPVAELGLAAQRAVLAALQSSEMPKGIAKIINSIDPAKASEEQIQALQANAVAYAQSIKTLSASFDSLPFGNIKGLAFDAADALVTASGGLESFSSNLKGYYDNFYSEEEKRAQTIKEINAATAGSGLDAATATRDSFRALVSAQDVTTESGQKTYAALLAVSGSFASITPAAEKAAASIATISDTLKGLLKDRESLIADVLQAQGDTGGADAARRATAIAGYNELEVAAYDYNQALRVEIKTRQDATAAAQAEAAERKGLQEQLNALTDTSAQALTRQRDAIGSSNQALFDQVQAATKQKAALDASSAAMLSFSNNIAGTIAKFNTPEQNATARYTSISEQLKSAGFATGSTDALVAQLQAASKDAIKAVAQQLFNGLDVGANDAKEALRLLVDQLGDIKNAEADAALKTTSDDLEKARVQTEANLAKLAASLARFGSALNLRVDLEGAPRTILGTVKTIQDSYTAAADGLQNLRPFADTYATRLAGIALTTTSALSLLFSSVNGGSFATDAKELEEELTRTGQGIGKNLALSGLSKYFADFGSNLTSLVDSLSTALTDGSSRLEAGLVDSNNMTRSGATLDQLGIGASSLTGAGTLGIAGAVGDAAKLIGKTLSDSLLASVSDSIKGNTAFSELLGPDLARLSGIISGVAKDDVQGLNDAFLLLTGSLADGKLTNTQYTAAIGLVNDAFKSGTDAAKEAAESIMDAYNRLRNATKTNEQIAQEKISLEDRLYEATDTTAQALERARNAIDPYNRALFDTVTAAEAAKAAQAEAKAAAEKGASDAFSALQRSVDAQRKIVQVARDAAAASVAEITSVFDILKSSVKDLYGSVDSTAKLQAEQGRAFISQALATAQSTGYLPESKALTDAINAAKGGTDEFASQFEKDFATLTLAGDLSLLEALSKTQLTAAEQALKVQDDQLAALDGVLSLAQQQLDAANGINTSVLSVAAALSNFATALGSLSATTGGVTTTGVTTATVAKPGDTAALAFLNKIGVQNFSGNIDYLGSVADQLGLSVTQIRDIGKTAGIPGFATGGIFGGGMRLVGENGPELEVTGPSRIFDASTTSRMMGGNTERLESLVEGLTKEVQRLQTIVNDGNRSNERIAIAVNGNPDRPMRVETVT